MIKTLDKKKRIAVQLPARISIFQSQEISCVIEEVGLEEAMVRVDDPLSEDVATAGFVTLLFTVPGTIADSLSEIPAQIISGEGARRLLAFDVPDQSAIQALNEWAFSQQSAGTSKPRFDSRRSHELFTTCRLAAKRFYEDRLPLVLEQCRDILFEKADHATSHIAQVEFFDAIQEAERVMPAINSGFFEEYKAKMGKMWAAERIIEEKDPADMLEELSLVDTGSFNDWLLAIQIITRAQRTVKDVEGELCSRLSQLLLRPVETRDVPFGLEGSCSMFHDSLQNLGALKITRHALLIGFELKMVKSLPELYGELNTLLGNAGIEATKEKIHIQRAPDGPGGKTEVPAAEPGPEQSPQEASPPPTVAEQPSPQEASLPPSVAKQPSPQDASPPPPVVEHPSPQDASPPPPVVEHPSLEAITQEPPLFVADRESAPISRHPGATPIWERDAYGTARTILHLSRGQPGPAGDELFAGKPAADVGTVLEALARIAETVNEGSTGGIGVLELAKHLKIHLNAAGLEFDYETADLINMVSDFIDEMLADPLVHLEVRERIRGLAFPLFRTALLGDPFFAVGPHPARQLLDALGIIQPDNSNEVISQIDAAIDNILRHTSPSRTEYTDALASIGPIAERQSQSLADTIENVAAKSEAQHTILESLRKSDAEQARADDSEDADRIPALFKKSLDRIDRFSVGEILILDADHFAPRPATLGWKSPDGQTFTFVLHSGLQAISFTRRALAMEFHRERIRKVEGAELALTERVLCRRLYMLHNQVQAAATHDTLTGLVNRKHFKAEVESSLNRADKNFDADHLCLVQPDGFEEIVQKFGRKASKQLLKTLAEMLDRQLGNAGIACRIKAHRFGILLHSGDMEDAWNYIQRFRRSVEEARVVLKNESFFLTVSAGVVTLDRESQKVDTAMSLAESALLAAAEAGGNRLQMAREEPAAGAEPEIVSNTGPNVTELIEQGRLFLRAQRIHPLQLSHAHTYHEILLGVRGPDGESLSPGPIVAAAEGRGQIGELDRWVVQEALSWMMAAPVRLEQAAGYSLNLSGATLSDDKLLKDILEMLSSTRIPPGKITFEITETAGIDSLPTARSFLSSMQDQGCKFSLDDFGVGHASFSYLRNLPVDKVKIDGMFVKDIVVTPNDRAVVQSINEITHFMGLHTVAEFVENTEILEIVREIGVDFVQGNGIAKAQPINELTMPPPPLASF